MNGKNKKVVILLIVVTISTLLASCGKNQGEDTSKINHEILSQGESIYPLNTDEKISIWMNMNPNTSVSYSTMNDTPFGKALQEKTGIEIEFKHPAGGMASEQFNLMVASGELADIIIHNWYNLSGGPEKYIEDGVIIKLNDVMKNYAPNLSKYLKDNPEIDKEVKTDSGSYYVFPFIRGDESLTVYGGPIIRQDLLENANMQIPETIDEWYETLKYFKEKGIEIPLSYNFLNYERNGTFSGAFGTKMDFYFENGKFIYGPVQPEMKEFLKTMNKWYNERLLDRNIANIDSKVLDSNMLNGISAATVGYNGGTLGLYLHAAQELNPEYNFIGAPYPVLNKGDKPKFGQRESLYVPVNCAAITTKCKNVEVATRLLDYGYSEEGSLLFNFGIEGESYNIVEGQPTFSDFIMNNPEGLSVTHALAGYMMMGSGPYIQDKRGLSRNLIWPQQKASLEVWMNTDAKKYLLPMITFTQEESSDVAKIKTEITTYVEETVLKFITGIKPIDEFDDFVNQVKKQDLDKLIDIYDAAYQRYLIR